MTDPTLTLDGKTATDKNSAWWLYIVHGVTFFFSLGLLSVIPLFLNYTMRAGAEGSFVHSHHQWMIRSFWWYLAWMVVGVILAVTIIGIPLAWIVFPTAWIWKAYRLIRGFIDLNANKPMPLPPG